MAEQSEFAKRCAWLMSTKRIALEPMDALVLFALHLHADEENRCWPKASVLCFETGMNEVTFYRKVKRLEKLKLVTRGRLKRTGGRYFCLHLDCPTDSVDCPTDSDCRRDSDCPTDSVDCPTDSVDCPTDSVDCPTDSPIELNKDIKGTVQELSKAAAWKDVGYDYQEDVCVRYDEDQNVTRQPVTPAINNPTPTPKSPPSPRVFPVGEPSSAATKSIAKEHRKVGAQTRARQDAAIIRSRVGMLTTAYAHPRTTHNDLPKLLRDALKSVDWETLLEAARAHGKADMQFQFSLDKWLRSGCWVNPAPQTGGLTGNGKKNLEKAGQPLGGARMASIFARATPSLSDVFSQEQGAA